MSRYRGPKCKICRRSREKLYLKGDKCYTAKCEIEKRNYPPGMRSIRPLKVSEYGRRLREKQKLRFFYGVSESQIRSYFNKASRQKGITGHNLLSLFELRLDNLVYRMSFARSRQEARQRVKHGGVSVNGTRVNVPSFLVRVGDEVSFPGIAEDKLKVCLEALKEKGSPSWITFNEKPLLLKIEHLPKRGEINVPVEEQLIVEYYSK